MTLFDLTQLILNFACPHLAVVRERSHEELLVRGGESVLDLVPGGGGGDEVSELTVSLHELAVEVLLETQEILKYLPKKKFLKNSVEFACFATPTFAIGLKF